jgi:hypothetical protein
LCGFSGKDGGILVVRDRNQKKGGPPIVYYHASSLKEAALGRNEIIRAIAKTKIRAK